MSTNLIHLKNGILNFLLVLGVQSFLYLLQFVFEPMIIFSTENDYLTMYMMLFIQTMLVSSYIMYRYEQRFRYWTLSIIAYYYLIHIYCPNGLYGITWNGFIWGMEAKRLSLNITITVYIAELFAWIMMKLICKQSERRV